MQELVARHPSGDDSSLRSCSDEVLGVLPFAIDFSYHANMFCLHVSYLLEGVLEAIGVNRNDYGNQNGAEETKSERFSVDAGCDLRIVNGSRSPTVQLRGLLLRK